MNNIASLIRQIAQKGQRPTIIVGQVTARDDEARTIDVRPSDGSAPLLGVALQSSTEGTTGIVAYPAIGSTVAVAMLTGYDAGFCILTDEVESIEYKVGDSTMVLTADGIVINGGELGGLVKVEALADKLNAIEQDLNTLKDVFSTWSPVAQDGGSALKEAAATWAGSTLATTSADDLSDTKVTH